MNKKAFVSVLSFVLLLISAQIVHADQISREEYSGGIYNLFFDRDYYDLLRSINTAKKYEVYPVSGTHRYSGRILKSEEIVFQANSNLVFDVTDGKYIAIVANKIKFKSPYDGFKISRNGNVILTNGANGGNGANRGYAGGGGANGQAGGNGGGGVHGKTQHLPMLYVLANEIVLESGGITTPIDLSFIFPGINGSNGGNGGKGGNGGEGGAGRGASQRKFKCRHQAGNGGRGGNAGVGGAAGKGGNGGNGANVTLIGPQDVVDKFSFSHFSLEPGTPGVGGVRGGNGSLGGGGRPGHRKGFCQHKPSHGPAGSPASNPHPSKGSGGSDGNRGKVHMIRVISIKDLLK